MSTNLQLCSELHREGRYSGAAPTAVTGQTGQALDIVTWIKHAWTELQGKHQDWRWMRSSFTVNTTASDDTYVYGDCTDTITGAAISRFARWLPWDTDGSPAFKSYLVSAGVGSQILLFYMTWGDFRYLYKTGTQTNGQPIHFTIDPQNNLLLGPKPDGIYTVTGDYQRGAQILAADGDTPDMPSRFHQLIVYDALKKHGGAESSPEALFRANSEGRALLRQLEKDQLPQIARARPLA